MSADLINTDTFTNRVGTKQERVRDKYFGARLALWDWRHEWAEAEKIPNHDKLTHLVEVFPKINEILKNTAGRKKNCD